MCLDSGEPVAGSGVTGNKCNGRPRIGGDLGADGDARIQTVGWCCRGVPVAFATDGTWAGPITDGVCPETISGGLDGGGDAKEDGIMEFPSEFVGDVDEGGVDEGPSIFSSENQKY